MVSRSVALFLIFVLGSTCLVLTDNTDFAGVQETNLAYKNHIPSYVSHEPFNITSDTDFETQSWPGNGSALNPYIIENLNITTKDSACIWIMNTTRRFIIRNCLFASPVFGYRGIQNVFSITLTNVSNGILYGNQWKNSSAGISGYGLNACTISSNLFNVTRYGIMIIWSNHTTIFNNTQEIDECYSGIMIYGGSDYTVYQNKFGLILADGISAYLINNSSFQDNLIRGLDDSDAHPTTGMEIWVSSNCNVSRNEIANFDWSGVEVFSGINHVIEDNTVSSSGTGITISASNSVLRRNNLINNSIS